MNERAGEEGPATAEFLDHGDRGNEVASLSPEFLCDRQSADSDVGEFSEELRREAVFAIETATQLGRQFGLDESGQGLPQQANMLGFFCEIHWG